MSILAVTVPATRRGLTTVATVKRELGITGSADHEFLEDLILQASAAIEGWCRRVFRREEVVETFRLSAERAVLHIARWPNVAIASIIEDGETLGSDFWEFDAIPARRPAWSVCSSAIACPASKDPRYAESRHLQPGRPARHGRRHRAGLVLTPVVDLDGLTAVTLQVRFAPVSGGTTCKAWVQTSLDQLAFPIVTRGWMRSVKQTRREDARNLGLVRADIVGAPKTESPPCRPPAPPPRLQPIMVVKNRSHSSADLIFGKDWSAL